MKFAVGEIVIVVWTNEKGWFPGARGQEVTVVEVGPFNGEISAVNGKPNFSGDYLLEIDGVYALALESQLRKRIDPQMPDEVRALFDVPVKSKEPA